ncbi:hypothetical protein G6F31_015789 [Rhizopus arrhizus]|nr:hypothetical protein G6F31_015789 [Rhizopus arrhizus]
MGSAVAGAGVVAQSGPVRHHVFLRGGGQRAAAGDRAAQHVGVDQAGRDAVDGDAQVRGFARHRFGQAQHGGFGGDVRGAGTVAAQLRGYRREGDDAAVRQRRGFASAQVGAAAQEDAARVDGEAALPDVQRGVLDERALAVGLEQQQPGGADQHGDRAVLRFNGGECAFDRGFIADVESVGGVRRTQFIGHAAGAHGVHVRHHDTESRARQLLADRGADAPAAAGHERKPGGRAKRGGRGYIGHAVS